MTPAIVQLKREGVRFALHSYEHDPRATGWGEEAVEKLGVPSERVFKTLVVAQEDGTLAVAVVPVAGRLNLKQLARELGCKRLTLAAPYQVERITGYVLGGVSPLGQKRRLRTVIDASAQQFPTLFVSAGRRGLELELAPDDLAAALGAHFAEIARDEG